MGDGATITAESLLFIAFQFHLRKKVFLPWERQKSCQMVSSLSVRTERSRALLLCAALSMIRFLYPTQGLRHAMAFQRTFIPLTRRSHASTQLFGRRGKGDGPKKKVNKENLPSKICVVCGRPFTWRKKWERCWDEVTCCSKSCNAKRRSGKIAEE